MSSPARTFKRGAAQARASVVDAYDFDTSCEAANDAPVARGPAAVQLTSAAAGNGHRATQPSPQHHAAPKASPARAAARGAAAGAPGRAVDAPAEDPFAFDGSDGADGAAAKHPARVPLKGSAAKRGVTWGEPSVRAYERTESSPPRRPDAGMATHSTNGLDDGATRRHASAGASAPSLTDLDDLRFALDGATDAHPRVRLAAVRTLHAAAVQPAGRRLLRSGRLSPQLLAAAVTWVATPSLRLAAASVFFALAADAPPAADAQLLTGHTSAAALATLLQCDGDDEGGDEGAAAAAGAGEQQLFAEVRDALAGRLPLAPGEAAHAHTLALLTIEVLCTLPTALPGHEPLRAVLKRHMLKAGTLDAVAARSVREMATLASTVGFERAASAGRLLRCLRVLEQASFESEENQMHLVLWSPERASSAGVASAVAPAARPAADAVASEAAEGDVDLDSAVASALSWASGRRENSRGTPAAGRGGAAPAAGTGSSRSRSGSGGGGGGSGSGGSGSGGSGSSGSRAKRGARTPEAAPADAAPATAAVAAAGSPAADSTFLAKLVGILPHMVSLVSWLAANRAAPAVSKAAQACTRAALLVLTNLTNDCATGCDTLAAAGGLEQAAALLPACAAAVQAHDSDATPALFGESMPSSDLLNAVLCLLVNAVEFSPPHCRRLAAVRLGEQRLAPWLGTLFSRVSQLAEREVDDAKSMQDFIDPAGAAGLGDASAADRQRDALISQAYVALLLACLLRSDADSLHETLPVLPSGGTLTLCVVLDRFCEFHESVQTLKGSALETLRGLVAHLRTLGDAPAAAGAVHPALQPAPAPAPGSVRKRK